MKKIDGKEIIEAEFIEKSTTEKLEIVLQTEKFEDMKNYLADFKDFVETIQTEVNTENKEDMTKLKANLNKAKDKIAEIRKAEEKKVKEAFAPFSLAEKLLKEKYEAINEAIKKEEEEEVKNRVKLFEDYYNAIKNGFPTFDFINFEEHFKIDKMKNKGNLTDGGDLTKKAKEYISGKLEEYEEAYLALHDDPIAIEKYKDTLNIAEAITYSKKIEELQKAKMKQQEEKAQKEAKEKEIKQVMSNEQEKEKVFVKNTSQEKKAEEFVEFTVLVPKKLEKSFEKNLVQFKMSYKKGE